MGAVRFGSLILRSVTAAATRCTAVRERPAAHRKENDA